MEEIKMNYGDRLIIDPCYIKFVKSTNGNTPRFDALRTERVLWDGEDGEFEIRHEDEGSFGSIGADSGRIWIMKAEFDITVDVGSGFSGHKVLTSERDKQLDLEKFSAISIDYEEY